jgi:hypothetical protein
MKINKIQNPIMKKQFPISIMGGLAVFCATLCCQFAQGQTLQFRYNFEDAPGTTTTDDSSSAIYPLTMNLFNSSSVAVDLHGPANSGIQNQGRSLNISTNPIAGNAGGSFAVVQNSSALGALGVVTNFTLSVWVKMPALETNTANQGSRIYNLMGTGLADIGGVNSLGFQPQLGSGFFPKVVMRGVIGNTFITPAIYYDFPTNVWLFLAMTYDTVSGNACLYYGTEASPAKLYVVKNIGAGTNFNFSGTPSFSLGDRPSKGRSFPGYIDDARFYTGSGDVNFVESVRQSSTPVIISNLSPDGSLLMSGTNTLSFTASSANGINPSNVKVLVNGANVSANLAFSGPATAQSVTYTNLPVNQSLIQQANLNAVNVSIQITDNAGIATTNSYVYDGFSPNNFTWECEDYDFGGGMYIDNPVYTFVAPNTNTYYQEQTPYVNFTDASDNGNLAGPSRIYRDPAENVETEYSIGAGVNGGQSIGELMRQKVLDAYNVTNIARDVNVGYFDGGTGSGLPNWMNYTRTYPNGSFNVYLRVADGGSALSASFDEVNSGWGTGSQTTTNIGVFTMANSGGWDSFAWAPLRDGNGNLVRLTLGGTNTLRLTAGTAGGGNVNFVMLTPANTNLPAISGVYPNGTNMFQPSATFSFVASSPSGVAISTNSISVRLTVTNLLGKGFVTNLTAINGLSITGPATNRTVSAVLSSNFIYTAAVSVTDANGSPAATTVSFDTISPVYTWEAEDYDYADGTYVDNPQTNAYAGQSADPGVDSFINADASLANTYRSPGGLGDQPDGDQPRLQYIGTGFTSYNVGWYDTGDWGNYTRTYPTGEFNLFIRAANGSGGNLGDTVSSVTSGWGTSAQTTTNLGTFTIPTTGNWQGYVWVPLRDAGGNLVKLTLGGTNTLRVTANPGGGGNANFYALFPANTNLPILSSVYPNGTTLSQSTNTFAFNVQSAGGVSTNSIVVTVNGVIVSNLVFSGSANNWNVSYPNLQPNTPYSITVAVTDGNGNSATTSATFDTMNPNNYTWEAEDFDHDGGMFIDNPQTNAYIGLPAVVDVDAHQVNFAGTYLYRPNGMDTEVNGDMLRPQYQDVNNPNLDYTMGYYSDGAWANYTRHYPAGSYNVYGRLACGGTAVSDATLSIVTSGWGTTTQTTNLLGTFAVPNTGWESYAYCPLRDASGNLVTVTFDGSTNTLQLGRPVDSPASPDVNANFVMLTPLFTISASHVGTNVVLSFPTVSGFNYQVQYTTNLINTNWSLLGSSVAGSNIVESVSDPLNGTARFYRVQAK